MILKNTNIEIFLFVFSFQIEINHDWEMNKYGTEETGSLACRIYYLSTLGE